MRDLDLYSSSIQFTVDGNLKLDVGEMIEFSEMVQDTAKKEQFYEHTLEYKINSLIIFLIKSIHEYKFFDSFLLN